jgi:hypothetical protein
VETCRRIHSMQARITYPIICIISPLPCHRMLLASRFYPSLAKSCLSVGHFSDLRRVPPISPYISLWSYAFPAAMWSASFCPACLPHRVEPLDEFLSPCIGQLSPHASPLMIENSPSTRALQPSWRLRVSRCQLFLAAPVQTAQPIRLYVPLIR